MQIAENPEIYSSKKNLKYREASVEKFPYLIVYQVYKQDKTVFVSSIHHAKKHPKTSIENKYYYFFA